MLSALAIDYLQTLVVWQCCQLGQSSADSSSVAMLSA